MVKGSGLEAGKTKERQGARETGLSSPALRPVGGVSRPGQALFGHIKAEPSVRHVLGPGKGQGPRSRKKEPQEELPALIKVCSEVFSWGLEPVEKIPLHGSQAGTAHFFFNTARQPVGGTPTGSKILFTLPACSVM